MSLIGDIRTKLEQIKEKKPIKILDLEIYYLYSIREIKEHFDSIISGVKHRKTDLNYLKRVNIGCKKEDLFVETIVDDYIKEFLQDIHELIHKTPLSRTTKNRFVEFLKVFNEKLIEYLKHIDTDEDDSKYKEIFMDTENFLEKNKGYLILYYLSTKGEELSQNFRDCVLAIIPFFDDDEVIKLDEREEERRRIEEEKKEEKRRIEEDEEEDEEEEKRRIQEEEERKYYYYYMLMNNFKKDKIKQNFRFNNDFFMSLISILSNLSENIDQETREINSMILELMLSIIKKGRDDYSELLNTLRRYKYYDNVFLIHSLNFIFKIFNRYDYHYERKKIYFLNFIKYKILGIQNPNYKEFLEYNRTTKEEDLNVLLDRLNASREDQSYLNLRIFSKLINNKDELESFILDFIKELNKRKKYQKIFYFIKSIPDKLPYI